MSVTITLVEDDEGIARCWPVLRELRPHVTNAAALVKLARAVRAEGAQFAALEDGGEITTVAVFRLRTLLVSGRTMYVDDLVTAERFRSRGYGRAMLQWLQERARAERCGMFTLDSGTFRQDAHAFYFREGMRIASFHFVRAL